MLNTGYVDDMSRFFMPHSIENSVPLASSVSQLEPRSDLFVSSPYSASGVLGLAAADNLKHYSSHWQFKLISDR